MQNTDLCTKVPPYDTGKVKIGLTYQRPQHIYMSADDERLQAALLGLDPRPSDRFAHFVARRPWSTMVIVVALFMAFSLVKGAQL